MKKISIKCTKIMIITDKDFATNIPIILKNEKIWVIGLSGGADSLCLTLLANKYCIENNIELIACFVDHKLRPESSIEIIPIINILNEKNIKYKVLVWHHDEIIEHNIEKKARDARYKLLYDFCKEIGSNVLLTAHHALDQWETFFMRISKGSSLKGLSCIQPISLKHDIILARPLLSFLPDDIKETLAKTFKILDFVKDPSNEDAKYERVRWRKAYSVLSNQYKLDAQNINKTVKRIQSANNCLNELADKFINENFIENHIIINKYKELPDELKIRILNRIITKIQRKEIISYSLLERVSNNICQKEFIATNIAGLILKKDRTKNIKIYRETR